MSSEGIVTLQKSLFLQTFLSNSSFFCSKTMKTIQAIKITIIFDTVALNNVDNFLTAR